MKTHVRVAVIGGGVVGCSVLYHLTKLGWSDVALFERAELTSGSTWHAAGGVHTLNSDPNVAKLQDYTIRLYREIEGISGQSCGIHLTGGLILAGTPERLDFLKTAQARGRYLGLESEIITVAEAKAKLPLLEERHFLGALYDPCEGHVDPAGVTHAYAKAARRAGAEIYRFTPVTAMRPREAGGWHLTTPKGEVVAETVVNAGGLWAREVGRMVGLELPLLAMEHQYLITDMLPEVAGRGEELPFCIDLEAEIYMRQEGQGLLLGTYEQDCRAWSEDTTPADFGDELLTPDLDRIAPSLEVAFSHFPALSGAGIKRVVNGPFTFAPDGNPLVGPVPGLRGYYVACAVMAGLSQGGGVGLALANWIVEGDPGSDIFAMDVARFGDFATAAYTRAKVRENYRRRFSIVYPNEELPAGRPLRTTPVYDRLQAAGAVFGAAFGLEHALWFGPAGQVTVETPSFRRSNAFAAVGEECRAVRGAVGLLEIANYAKYEVSGPAAERWLDWLLAGRLPTLGRLTLSPMLDTKGRLMGDFTVARLAPERFCLFGSGIAEAFHLRWFAAHRPAQGVTIRSLTAALGGFAIAGPRARDLLARLTRRDAAAAAFPFRAVREMDVGLVRALVVRLSYTGELGYEIYAPLDCQIALYGALREAGEDLGVRLFGARALNSLRLEKGFGAWTREFTPDVTPAEAGLMPFVDPGKRDFVGRAALAAAAAKPKLSRVTLLVNAAEADAWGDEPVFHDGQVVGYVTSGGYGHCVEQSIALAYVPPALAKPGLEFAVEILGDKRPARSVPIALYDPTGARMRG